MPRKVCPIVCALVCPMHKNAPKRPHERAGSAPFSCFSAKGVQTPAKCPLNPLSYSVLWRQNHFVGLNGMVCSLDARFQPIPARLRATGASARKTRQIKPLTRPKAAYPRPPHPQNRTFPNPD